MPSSPMHASTSTRKRLSRTTHQAFLCSSLFVQPAFVARAHGRAAGLVVDGAHHAVGVSRRVDAPFRRCARWGRCAYDDWMRRSTLGRAQSPPRSMSESCVHHRVRANMVAICWPQNSTHTTEFRYPLRCKGRRRRPRDLMFSRQRHCGLQSPLQVRNEVLRRHLVLGLGRNVLRSVCTL